MTMNTEHLLQLANVLEAAGERFNLCWFAAEVTEDGRFNRNREHDAPASEVLTETNCNTVGCVAGWANAIGNPGTAYADNTTAAAEWLGLKPEVAREGLFFATEFSIWYRVSKEYGWKVDDEMREVFGWDQITGAQAADVLRRLARGELTL